jgi:hypothetical protein
MLAPTRTPKIISFPIGRRSAEPVAPSLTPVLDVMPTVESRLEELAVIAPQGTVSVLFIRTDEPDSYQFERLGIMLWRYLRPTDSLHRATEDAWAIVLQGAGTRTAATIAARIEFELNHRTDAPAIEVGVATGTGANSTALVAAAAMSFPEVG